jgi:hypothetical protein
VRPRFTFFLTTAAGASAFLFFPISVTRTFVPSNKALIKTASNEDDAKKKKFCFLQILYPAKQHSSFEKHNNKSGR